jgi:hypothetical protein
MLAALPALGHERFRVVGTITQQQATAIQIAPGDGRIVSVALDVITRIRRGGERAAASELKVGQRVDVDALGDSEEDLMALEVTILPSAGAPAR